MSLENSNQTDPASHTEYANDTIKTLLTRRTIRSFKPDPVNADTVETLERVAQQAATSSFNNAWLAIRITDADLKRKIAVIGRQDYIAQAPLLYIFVVDFRRNSEIARAQGVDMAAATAFRQQYNFNQGQDDAVLALHAMETAAESLGLGTLVLGSILNSVEGLIDLLNLPELVFPILGLAIGTPNEEPAIKPRMDRSLQFFENHYPHVTKLTGQELVQKMAAFDERLQRYHDLRYPERTVGRYTDIIPKHAQGKSAATKRIADKARAQGFDF